MARHVRDLQVEALLEKVQKGQQAYEDVMKKSERTLADRRAARAAKEAERRTGTATVSSHAGLEAENASLRARLGGVQSSTLPAHSSGDVEMAESTFAPPNTLAGGDEHGTTSPVLNRMTSEATSILGKQKRDEREQLAQEPAKRRSTYDMRTDFLLPEGSETGAMQSVTPQPHRRGGSVALGGALRSSGLAPSGLAPSYLQSTAQVYTGSRSPQMPGYGGFGPMPSADTARPLTTQTEPVQGEGTSDAEPAKPNRGRGRPPSTKTKASDKQMPTLDTFAWDEATQAFRTLDDLDLEDDTAAAMVNHTIAMCAPGSRLTGFFNKDHKGKSPVDNTCVRCRDKGKATHCTNASKTNFFACNDCVKAGETPCGTLIAHPDQADSFAVGYYPLPTEHRKSSNVGHIDFWVLSGGLKTSATDKVTSKVKGDAKGLKNTPAPLRTSTRNKIPSSRYGQT